MANTIKAIATYDENKDKALSKEELKKLLVANGADVAILDQIFAAADANSDGKISEAEANERTIVLGLFAETDTNTNKVLELEELE